MAACSRRRVAASSRRLAVGNTVRLVLGSRGRVVCLIAMFALGLVVSSQFFPPTRADGVSVVATNVGYDGILAAGDGGHYGFYAQGRYWSYYSDNVDEMLKSTTDGVTWSAPTVIRPVVFGEYFVGAFDGTYFHYGYADGYNVANVLYRRGMPNADGSITWSAPEQVVQACALWHHTGDVSCWYAAVGVDSTGHPWVGWLNGGSAPFYAYVSKSSTTDGTWSTASGFPFAVYSTCQGNCQVHIVPLTAAKMYFTYAGFGDYVYGRLWNGASMSSAETISAAPISSDAFGGTHVTAVNIGDDVHLVYLNTDTHTYIYYKRTYSLGTWTSGATIATNIAGDGGHISSFPAMSVNGTSMYLFWLGSPDPNHAYYLSYSGGNWATTRTDWLADTQIADIRDFGVFYSAMSNRIGFFYESGSSGYTLKFTQFQPGATIQTTMTVSYTNVGGGSGYSAPVFNYIHNGANAAYTLTTSPTGISCDSGSAWSVTPNPLGGSSSTERWESSQTLSGTASGQALVFTFYHQYLQTLSYTIVGDGSGYAAPTFTAAKNGTSTPQVLSASATGYWYDSGSSWTVTNPLGGSGSSERWNTSQSTSGTITSEQTTVFSYQHQYTLTMLVNPSGAGTTLPTSGWQNAGTAVGISAAANPGYTFQSWSGTGSVSYSGYSNSSSVTINSAITETASFSSQITMTVSYSVIGSGTGYSAPTFNYVQGGSSRQYTLTGDATGILTDPGSVWAVSPNPLTGSGASERWISSQTLSGTVSVQTIVFSFQHQYTLTTGSSPSGAGSTTPVTGWQDAGSSVGISATPGPGYLFQSWVGSGPGNYSGTSNPSSVTMTGAIIETAEFLATSPPPATMTVSYVIIGDGSGYAAPALNYVLSGSGRQAILNQTAGSVQCDIGSAWSVTPNPLTGSGSSERWYSGQVLSGAASTQTLVFSFQHQYVLTMEINPPGTGSTTPTTDWQNAGATVNIQATSNTGYAFQSWIGSGTGSYSGTNNPTTVTMNAPISETATFTSSQQGEATMTVSYTVVGSGAPAAPIFNYVEGGQSKQSALTQSPAAITVDAGSPWTVASNPLGGSNNLERWYSTQSLSGTASLQTIEFTFQHQYYLIMHGSEYYGSVDPDSGWQNAGAQVQITVTPQSGHTFQAWAGSGSGSYSGTDNPATVTMNAPITEVANFASENTQPQTAVCKFASVGQAVPGGGVYIGRSESNAAQSTQLPLLLLGTLAPGAFMNRRGLRWLRKRGGHRGGISKMVATLILIVFVVGGIVGISLYYSVISGGAVSHQDMLLTGSMIKVNAAEDSGSVYVKIHNAGMSAAMVSTITVSGHLAFAVNFTDATGRVPSGWTCTCSGGQGVAVGGKSPNGYLVIPSGADVSILSSASTGMTAYFTPGTAYDVSIMLYNGPELRFTIPAESSP